MKKVLSLTALVAVIAFPTFAFASDMGEILKNSKVAAEAGFGLFDALIYILGVFTIIGGMMGLKNARGHNNPGGAKVAGVAILIGLGILGWKGYVDAFYKAQGVDVQGSGYQRPTM